jgi:hypothetical protein
VNAPLRKLSELTGVEFDGRRTGYVPPKKHEKEICVEKFRV